MRMKTTPLLLALAVGLLTATLTGCGGVTRAPELSERQKTAQAMFAERCKRAGEKIYRTVDNVEGIFLLKLRLGPPNDGDQFRMDDPYGRDLNDEGYIASFLRGSEGWGRAATVPAGWPQRIGYLHVDAIDPRDGKRYRYTGAQKAVRRMDPNARNVQADLKRDPNFDLNVYQFVVSRTVSHVASGDYGVTYDDISTKEDRDYWIAGSILKVVDVRTNEVLAQRIGYMYDPGQGNRSGGRSPWLMAADYACPDFHRVPNPRVRIPGPSAQVRQTQDFVEKVLRPVPVQGETK